MANISIISIEERQTPSSIGPRVAGLAEQRLLNGSPFDGYSNVTVPLPLTRLMNEDLDEVLDIQKDYYADAGNSVNHKPGGVDGFGMKLFNLGDGAVAQQIIDKATKKIWTRIFDGTYWEDWNQVFASNNPQSIPATSEYATKLSTARRISIDGITKGSVMFDGSSDVVINTEGVAYLGNEANKLYFEDSALNFGGTDTSTTIYIGKESVDNRAIPTSYDFGSADIHAINFFKGITNLDDIYSPIVHDHDGYYSKLGHTHTMDDLNIEQLGESLILSDAEGNEIFSYNGSSRVEKTITPETIGAASIEHGIHVAFDDENLPANVNTTNTASSGISASVARADHVHTIDEDSLNIKRLSIINNNILYDWAPNFDTPTFRLGLKESSMLELGVGNYYTVAVIQGDAGDNPRGKAYELAFGYVNDKVSIKLRDGEINGSWSDNWVELYHSGNLESASGLVRFSGNGKEVDDSNVPKTLT